MKRWHWIVLVIVIVIIRSIIVLYRTPPAFKKQVKECKKMRETMKFASPPPPCEVEVAKKMNIELKEVPKTNSKICPTGWKKIKVFRKVYCTPY